MVVIERAQFGPELGPNSRGVETFLNGRPVFEGVWIDHPVLTYGHYVLRIEARKARVVVGGEWIEVTEWPAREDLDWDGCTFEPSDVVRWALVRGS